MVPLVASGVETLEGQASTIEVGRLRAVVDDPRWALFVGLVVLNLFDIVTTAMV